MAENENGQEQSEQPTAKRIREARERGQVARSRELNTFTVMIVGAAYLSAFGGGLGRDLSELMKDALVVDRALIFDPSQMVPHLAALIGQALMLLAPLFVALIVAAFAAPIAVGGMNFTSKAFAPKFSKLNPASGLKRIFSVQGLMELVKALGKFFVVALVAGFAIKSIWTQLISLGEHSVYSGIAQAGHMASWVFLIACSGLLFVALIDVPFQLWNYNKQLRMTLQEVKDEYKETEGKPEVKGRIRQLQYEMARRRMMSEVPKADVIITNPTHYAVAISYEASTMRAPKLLAKGMDETAMAIRAVAEEHRIMRVEAPRVARAIYFTTELEQEIPQGLFVAVARILAYVYQLKRHDESAELPDDLPVPEDYLDPGTARQARRGV